MAALTLSFLCAVASVRAWPARNIETKVQVPTQAPADAGVPLDSFVSFSVEFSYFPDYAGNLTHPNTFSNNLLNNIAAYSGAKPYVRVGGSSQDNALFVEAQEQGAILQFADPPGDQPTNLTFGPNFFQSYHTWPGTKFTHGFNLKYNSTEDHEALIASVPYACSSLASELLAWELGNEPDLYNAFGRLTGAADERPPGYDAQDYVSEWLNLTEWIRSAAKHSCPGIASDWYAPSFAQSPGLSTMNQTTAFADGLDADKDLLAFAAHHYQGSAYSGGITLFGSLMNHSATAASVGYLVQQQEELRALPNYPSDLPFILGEGNSIAGQGTPGLSNTFGAALWSVDANLLMAANNIQRFHMHQGLNYRYQAWQPLDTNTTSIGTKAPYYASIAVAAFLGDLTDAASRPQVVNIDLGNSTKSAYASFVKGQLSKIMLLNLQDYNTTVDNDKADTYPRSSQSYIVQLPSGYSNSMVSVQRLTANGSDAITGITFDGWSYNYELDNGKPVRMSNVTIGETLKADGNGRVKIQLPDSSAALLTVQESRHGSGGW